MNDQLTGLARNPSLPAHLLDRMISLHDESLQYELAGRADLTPTQARQLATMSDPQVAAKLVARGLLAAADADTSEIAVMFALAERGEAAALSQLAAHPDIDVVADVALLPHLTHDLGERIAAHPHLAVRRALAANEHAPSDILRRLAEGTYPVASWCPGCDGTPYCCDDCRTQMWKCEDGDHEYAMVGLYTTLAANKTTPPDAVEAWVPSPYMFLREAIAARTDLASGTYQILVTDPVAVVRQALARNPAIGENLIREMAADPGAVLARDLTHNPAIPLDLLAKLAPHTKIGPTLLPRIANATPQEVRWLAAQPVPQVRMLLAERRDLPDEILERLAADSDPIVLKSLAPNPALSAAHLQSMVDRHGVSVAARVAMNPMCSPALLLQLARLSPQARKSLRPIASHPHSPGEALMLCLWEPRAREVAAAHPALPTEVLISLLDDPDWQVATAAASNPALPVPLMETVLQRVDDRDWTRWPEA